ncbi:type II toxin-antitoxin system VapC family toxin [Candidatus Gottesmanbacteria bacterium]|nr:type II toxin-antitoxin system VapC family toxin [Candidatus Gottesmanbacteria bacterium]
MARPTKFVVDSSVLVKWVNSQDEQYLQEADALANDCKKGKVILIAPELAKYEVGNALWKKVLPIPQAQASLGTIYAGPVEFVKQDEAQAMRAMEIAVSSRMTFYDASFVSLAEQRGAKLVTDNPKHQQKVKSVTVVPIKEYR